ncbi:DNA primase [Wolbachia endosymbiont of Howardula sp.]|uniref:DNA primase n=1 Tax=Wolbachia endosymbiont of Howardula sp. TaxID=2916816 RepID=UPI00217ED9EE|nr:DNA primase [Wolbachia endosymbiont of Howardula sp.]UWI83186.1 DNA primase [Wolbachia endosymbiont of Howardula sp.]
MNYIAEIKSKLLLSDIIGQKVGLIKRGESFIGLCPFHHEKTPSFFVSNIKGVYHCFGCYAHGDAFEFISQTEGLTFIQSIEKLSYIVGLERPKDFNIFNHNKQLFAILNVSANWFAQNTQDIMHYFHQRNISSDIIKKFNIGYAPEIGLKEFLHSLGIQNDILLDIGLIKKSYDVYFRKRVIFPIYDHIGRVVGFGGRVLNAEQHPKYLNSPESKIFKKKEHLYGLHFALHEIRKQQTLFVVEGYMDVLALHQAGISNSIASLGTMLSKCQIQTLWQFSKEIAICMDGDIAGQAATIRIAELALPILTPGYTLKFITLSQDKDPYDICNDTKYNPAKILHLFDQSTKFHSEFLWHYIVSNNIYDNEKLTPEKYSVIEYQCMKYINNISNKSIKRYYKDYFYHQVHELSRNCKNNNIIRTYAKEKCSENFLNKSPALIESEHHQALILRIVIEFPEILNNLRFFEHFSLFIFTETNMKRLQQDIVHMMNMKKELHPNQFDHQSEIIKYILNKTYLLNNQLKERISAESVWNNVILLSELHALKKEKIQARINGHFDLEQKLIVQIKQIESNIQDQQMSLIHNYT